MKLMHVDWRDLSCETPLFNQKQTTVYVDKFGDQRLVAQNCRYYMFKRLFDFFEILYI